MAAPSHWEQVTAKSPFTRQRYMKRQFKMENCLTVMCHAFMPQTFTEHLLSARGLSRRQRHSSEQSNTQADTAEGETAG